LINLRTDTLRRGAFRHLLAGQRAIVPADGFYEWRDESGLKQPYFFYRKDGEPILFAALWDWSEVKGDRVPSFALLTDEPNELVAPYHDRMPVIIDDPRPWLENGVQPLDSISRLDPGEFAVRPVSTAVNRVAEKDITVIEDKYEERHC
jgi:putative SOS response-associated peptidase YedK